MRITKENSYNSFKFFFLLITFPLSMDLYLDLKVTSFLLLCNRPGVELISLLLQSRPGLKLILNLHTLNPSYTPFTQPSIRTSKHTPSAGLQQVCQKQICYRFYHCVFVAFKSPRSILSNCGRRRRGEGGGGKCATGVAMLRGTIPDLNTVWKNILQILIVNENHISCQFPLTKY